MTANEMHYFPNLFDEVLYMFRICPLSIVRSISTLYTHNRYFFTLIFRGPCIVIYSYNETQRDALFPKFI